MSTLWCRLTGHDLGPFPSPNHEWMVAQGTQRVMVVDVYRCLRCGDEVLA